MRNEQCMKITEEFAATAENLFILQQLIRMNIPFFLRLLITQFYLNKKSSLTFLSVNS